MGVYSKNTHVRHKATPFYIFIKAFHRQSSHFFSWRQCSVVFLHMNCLEYVRVSREISKKEHLVDDIQP